MSQDYFREPKKTYKSKLWLIAHSVLLLRIHQIPGFSSLNWMGGTNTLHLHNESTRKTPLSMQGYSMEGYAGSWFSVLRWFKWNLLDVHISICLSFFLSVFSLVSLVFDLALSSLPWPAFLAGSTDNLLGFDLNIQKLVSLLQGLLGDCLWSERPNYNNDYSCPKIYKCTTV